MKLKILGKIVSADYDDPFFADWIDRGIITPSSRIVAALDSLGKGEKVELYINSYGGDVFAGGEMLIALEKAHASGRLASVKVGAIAASMAANIIAALKARGAKVSVYGNSTLMFHGCYTYTEGGAQHHEDVAASLRNINNAVIADLNRIGITDCRAWFAEGREKWIDANEAVSLKLADEISIGVGDASADAKKNVLRLAACATKVTNRTEYQMELDKIIMADETAETTPGTPETPADTPKPAENAPVDAPEGADAESADPATDAAEGDSGAADAPEETPAESPAESPDAALAEMEKRLAGLQAAKDKEIAALRDEVAHLKDELDTTAKALDAAKASAEQLKADIEARKAALAETQAALEREKEAHLAIVGAALKPQAEGSQAAKSWRNAYRAMRDEKTAK